jgi:bacillolysin
MKIFLYLALSAIPVLCMAQDDKPGHTIERNKDGSVSSVRFSSRGEEKNIPASADVFLREYLEVKPDDQFNKVPHVSKREEFVHEHYDQYYKGVKVEGAKGSLYD